MIGLFRTQLTIASFCWLALSQSKIVPVPANELDSFALGIGVESQRLERNPSSVKEVRNYELINYYMVESCILATFTTYLLTKEGNHIKFEDGIVDKSASSCGNADTLEENQLTLAVNFEVANIVLTVIQKNSLTYINSISGDYYRRGSQMSFANESTMLAVTRIGDYYKCNSEQAVSVGDAQTLMISNLLLEAYRNSASTSFIFSEDECPLDSVQSSTTLIQWIIVVLLFVTIVSLTSLCRWIAKRELT